MYTPKHFEVDDHDEIFKFLEKNSFGQLISMVEDRLFGSPIPFFVNQDQKTLFGHVAKHNPQWKNIEAQEVLITFQGPHAYVSPSWYCSPGIPTWNYQAVHVYGNCRLVTETKELATIVNELTRKNEASSGTPWNPEYNPSLLNAIVGLKIEITEIQCKYKLSQNRSSRDREQVAQQLEKRGATRLSLAVKNEFQ